MSKGVLNRKTNKSAGDTALTLATTGKKPRRLVMVTAKYSAAPTQAGVTVGIDSGAGADYDSTLYTGSANAQNNVYVPDGEVLIKEDDQITVTAPAGGGVITSAIAIYTEDIGF